MKMLMSQMISIDNDIIFDQKAKAVPYNYRVSYKVSQLCFMMYICCRKQTCSITKLHILSTCLLSENEFRKVLRICNEDANIVPPVIRYDPAVTLALQFAIADGFISQQTNQKISLTDKGKKLALEIDINDTLMIKEKQVLCEIKKKLTDVKVQKISTVLEEES